MSSEHSGQQSITPKYRRYFATMGLLTLLSWTAFGLDYYLKRSEPIFVDSVLGSWRFDGSAFTIDVNGHSLLQFKASDRLLLVIRIAFSDLDRMTDTNLEKSRLYTIQDGMTSLSIPITEKFLNRFNPYGSNMIQFNLLLLPAKYSADHITSLADVETLGGKIIGTPGFPIMGRPALVRLPAPQNGNPPEPITGGPAQQTPAAPK
jgi:hypothetical protein